MHFLTFDTSLDKTYVTLCADEKIIASKIIESDEDKYHSAYLISMLASVLSGNGLTMQDIKAIGVNIGPGSFTGIRACITVARVIAQQLDLPLVGVSSLEILAKINSASLPTVVLMDARKGMCYFAEYSADGGVLQDARLEPIDSLCINDKTHKIIADNVMCELLKTKGLESTCFTDVNADLGQYLAELTCKKLKTSGDFHWAVVKPLYLQMPSITMPKKSLL